MNFKNILEKPKSLTSQLILIFLIFLIFAVSFFAELPLFFWYLHIALIVVNLVLGFVNNKKSLFFNLSLLILALVSYVFLIGFLAIVFGIIISFVYLVLFGIKFFKEEETETKKKKN